jgi:UDPglucose--hexose-1-phosphate uridylyltransferase
MNERMSLKRWHPLIGEWVIIAPVTSGRPWSGSAAHRPTKTIPEYDPDCYLCPGVKRASGKVNPQYRDAFVFDNDFPSFSMSYSTENEKLHPADIPASGICRVVCFSPQHNTTLAEMNKAEITKIISTFQKEYFQLSSTPGIESVLIFENKGEIIGVSNLHPHGQIYATDFVPRILLSEYTQARQHMEKKGTCLFCDILAEELQSVKRVVCQNTDFVAYVPYFARYAYEVHIVPRRHVPTMTALKDGEIQSLADIYQEVLVRYDNLFEMPFPNITLFHNAPCAERFSPEPFHFHIEFCPPLRSADKMKYMAGFETGGGNVINPSQPEESAEILRSLSSKHYTRRSI